jgi:hypothetical protein
MNKSTLKFKTIVTIILLLIFLIAGVGIAGRINKATVKVDVAPSVATLKIDGKIYKSGKVSLPKGIHTFEASYENFATYTKEVEVINSDQEITISLQPSNENGKRFLEENEIYQKEREAIGSREFGETSQKLSEKYPFIAKLPIERQKFSINYGEPRETKNKNPDEPYIALYISTVDPSEKRNALKTISEDLGVDPSQVEIVFENSFNAFSREAYDE